MARDIFAVLKADHREILDLLKQVAQAREAASRQRLFERLRDELEAHALAERDVVYGRLRREDLTRETILQGEQEHHVLHTLLRELGRMKPDGERFSAKLHVLREMVRHHVHEEESDLFPKARQALRPGEATELVQPFLESKEATLSG